MITDKLACYSTNVGTVGMVRFGLGNRYYVCVLNDCIKKYVSTPASV